MKTMFAVMAFTLATIVSANADTTCAVNSPDGELNVRELTQDGPGKVIGTVKNGYTVTMRDFYLLKGKSWARVVDGKTQTKVVGWMFKDYLNCNIQAAAPAKPVAVAPQQQQQRPTTTGKALQQRCDSSNPVDEQFCDGFVTGLFQWMWIMQEVDQPIACMVPNVKSNEIIDVTVEHIRRSRNAQDVPGAMAVVDAVVNKFGSKCPKS
jgi:Rap1a immunity proteins